MDLNKLTPAPWYAQWQSGYGHRLRSKDLTIGRFDEIEDAEFVALARNAFDVMMRRNWGVRYVDACPIAGKIDMKWQAIESRPGSVNGINSMIFADDPFTALVEADKWLTEQEKGATHDAQANG